MLTPCNRLSGGLSGGCDFRFDVLECPADIRPVDAQLCCDSALGVALAVQVPDFPFPIHQTGCLNRDISQLPGCHLAWNNQAAGYPVLVETADERLAADRVAFFRKENSQA